MNILKNDKDCISQRLCSYLEARWPKENSAAKFCFLQARAEACRAKLVNTYLTQLTSLNVAHKSVVGARIKQRVLGSYSLRYNHKAETQL